MSDANRTQIGIIEETTMGSTPATPAFETLRVTVPNLALSKSTTSSKELRADENIPDRITTFLEAAGDLSQEVSYGALDTILRGAMRSEWLFAPVRDNNGTADSNITDVTTTDVTYAAVTNPTTKASSGSFAVGHLVRTSGFTAAGNNALRRAGAGTTSSVIKLASGTADSAPVAAARAKAVGFEGASADITATATGLASTALDFTTLGLRAGQWIWVGGPVAGQTFATAANVGWARIHKSTAITATALPLDVLPTGWGVDAGTGKTIRVYFGDVIRNGTTRRTYTLEQQFQDLTNPTYEYYRGMLVSQLELTAQAASILESKATFLGMTASTPATSRLASATDVAGPTSDVMNASNNVGTMLLSGAAITGGNFVTGLTLTINNTGRRNNAVGANTSVAVQKGQFMVTVKLSTYYGDPTILTLIRNSTAASYFVPFIDPTTSTKALVFDLPRIKFGDGSPTVPGINADRMLDTDFQGVYDTSLACSLNVARLEEFNT